MLLKKYQLVNLPKDARILKTARYGDLNIERLTDEQAEKLFNDGSRYVKQVSEKKSKKGE